MLTSLSVIVPFYNEEENLAILHQKIVASLPKSLNYEIIYINDGSTDKSGENLKSLLKQKKKTAPITLITFTRNFGQTAATAAGIETATGEIIAFLDADLQNDPADLPKLLKKYGRDTDVVLGWRRDRSDSALHTLSSQIINLLTGKVFKLPFHDTGCSLKIVKRSLLSQIRLYGEYHRLLPAILFWRGARIVEVPVRHHPRLFGKSKYNYLKLYKYLVDLLTIRFFISYGDKPNYVFSLAAAFSLLFSFIAFLEVIYEKFALGIYVHRNPVFIIGIFLSLLSAQFFLMGLLAELVVRTYYKSREKKTYDIKNVTRF